MATNGEVSAIESKPRASRHFRLDTTALSYGELWETSKVAFPLTALFKALGVDSSGGILAPLSTSLGRLEWESMPSGAREKLTAAADALSRCGFSQVLLYTEDWRRAGLEAFTVAMLDDERTTMVLVTHTCLRTSEGRPSFDHMDLVFHSRIRGRRPLVTWSTKYTTRRPPEYDVSFQPELPPAEVAKIHAHRMSELRNKNQPYREEEPFVVVEPDEVPGWILELSQREAEFHAERGYFVPATAEDLARAERPLPTKDAPTRFLVWAGLTVLAIIAASLRRCL